MGHSSPAREMTGSTTCVETTSGVYVHLVSICDEENVEPNGFESLERGAPM